MAPAIKVCKTVLKVFLAINVLGFLTILNYTIITGRSWRDVIRVEQAGFVGFKLRANNYTKTWSAKAVYPLENEVDINFKNIKVSAGNVQKEYKEIRVRHVQFRPAGKGVAKGGNNGNKTHRVPATQNGTVSSARGKSKIVYRDFDLKDLKFRGFKIPHIIHQGWKYHNIPEQFVISAQSWVKLHPTWEYWFWTHQDVLALLRKKYPQFLHVFHRLKSIHGMDLMKYFVLHQFGGVYSDLGIEALKNFENVTKHSCVLAQKLDNAGQHGRNYSASDSIMAATPKHEFFKRILEKLQNFRRTGHTANPKGLNLLTTVLDEYKNQTNEHTENETVYLANSILQSLEQDRAEQILIRCNQGREKMSPLQIAFCKDIAKRNFGKRKPNSAYAKHSWLYTHKSFTPDLKKSKNILKLIQKAKNVKKVIDRL